MIKFEHTLKLTKHKHILQKQQDMLTKVKHIR